MAIISNPSIGGEAQQPTSATAYCPRCGKQALGAQFCSACGADLGLPGGFASPAVAAAPRAIPWGRILVVIGGGLAVLGSFLPWISMTAPLVGSVTKSGIEGGGDGIVTLVVGLVVALLGVALVARSGSTPRAVLGTVLTSVVLGGLAFYDMADVNTPAVLAHTQLILEDNPFTDAVNISTGMGLYVILVGAVLGFVGAIVALRAFRTRSTT